MIELPHCTIFRMSGFTLTAFRDGTEAKAVPSDQEFYPGLFRDVGCEGDPERYTFEHEVIHSFLAQKMWDRPSYVVWGEAHGRKLSVVGAWFEERWVWHFHRFFNGISHPLEPEWYEWANELKGLFHAGGHHYRAVPDHGRAL